MQLSGKVAVVTGAASGIGKAIAVRFAREGASVILADVTEDPREEGEKTLDVIDQSGGEAIFVHTDVSSWDQVDNLVTRAVRAYGRLDVMVNNAAIDTGKPILETPETDWDRVMGVNLKGVFFGCKRAISQMLQQEPRGETRGRIINITSQHGMIAAPNNFVYGVSKSGVVYMTRQIARDYADQHIICNAVAPGRILIGKPVMEADPLDYAESRTPMPRLGRPEDVASACVFLASDDATYITGINLLVDGGWMAS